MKVLKMIADWRYNDNPPLTRERRDIPMDERDNNSYWYLHGKLEDFVRFDKATVTNCLSGGFARRVDYVSRLHSHEMHFNGVVDVEIEGIDKPCKGFFYTTDDQTYSKNGEVVESWKQRGLVCFADDKEACEYAMNCLKTKCNYL